MPITGSPPDPWPDLPVDPDLAGLDGRSTHLRPGLVGLVLAGGAVGAPVRYAIARQWATPTGGFGWSTLTVNASGAFALGLLLEILARAGTDTGARRAVRLLLGTGLLGAFTTYSTFAVEADLLIRAHRTGVAVAYAVGGLAAGLIACLAGIAIGAVGHRLATRSAPPPPPPPPPSTPTPSTAAAGRPPTAVPAPVEESG